VRVAEEKQVGCSEVHEQILSHAGCAPILAQSKRQESRVLQQRGGQNGMAGERCARAA
jgi:hypothetical protein